MRIRLGIKDIKRVWGIHLLVLLLLVAVLLIVVFLISAVQVKFRKYSALAPYFDKKGIYVEGSILQNEQGILFRDEEEIKEYFPETDKVLSMSQIWVPYIKEYSQDITLWCYSSGITDLLSPDMESGRWFSEDDINSDILKAVAVYNSILKPGDTITIGDRMSQVSQQVEIIGVMKNNESIYYNNDMDEDYGDYRDFYYTYNEEAEEGNLLLLITDSQILKGDKKEAFASLNYRLQSQEAFQKQICGGTMFIYPDSVSQKIIEKDKETLNRYSKIDRIYSLSEMKKNSWNYILEELYNYLPVFICVFLFVVIAAVSANAITVKKQLKNYAVYYICGLSWKNCAGISLCVALLTSAAAVVLVAFSMCICKLIGISGYTGITFGLWQLLACVIILFCYIMLAWSVPLTIVKGTSAKEVMTSYTI